jgi:murein L,D-transpeptidase YafK
MVLMKTGANTTAKSRSTRIVLVIFCVVVAVIGTAVAIRGPRRITGRLPDGTTIDRIVVEKSARKLSVLHHGKEIKNYRIALGGHPIGPKEQEGDMKTPEGLYAIDSRNPHSDYHLALHISYPKPDDVARAAARGVSAGSDIMIHGLPNGQGWIGNLHQRKDWTLGCIAVTDEEIEELWRITPDGTPIEIRP